jgi:hypothetical protein
MIRLPFWPYVTLYRNHDRDWILAWLLRGAHYLRLRDLRVL